MRELTGHKVNPANDRVTIEVMDEAGSGGANHLYLVSGFHTETNPSRTYRGELEDCTALPILFQNGPIAENGVNGLTQEVLLEIVADRLRCFQAGPYASRENAVALTHVETAQLWLQKRTFARMARGVEGTHKI